VRLWGPRPEGRGPRHIPGMDFGAADR